MPRAFQYILFLVFSVASVFSTDVIVTDARKIIIGQVENETIHNIQIKDHRKIYTIPKNRIEFKFNLPEITTEEKIKLLPKGLPLSLDKIDKCQGLFMGLAIMISY